MSRNLIIVAYGRPAPQGSKHGGNVGQMMESSRFLPAWRGRVTAAAISARAGRRRGKWVTATGPVSIEIAVTQTRNPTSPPDWDKLARAICDSLTTAGVYRDDAQIIDGRLRKLKLGEPGALSKTGAWILVVAHDDVESAPESELQT